MSPAPAIAVIGLGIIGSRAAGRLGASATVRCWNRTPKGASGETTTLEEAAGPAEWILLFLKDAAAVREVAGRILDLPPGRRVIVNHSTVDLATTHWLAERCAERGFDFLDCPFTGSRDAAASGGLVYYAAGPDALIDRAEPLLRQTSRSVLRCGPVGAATVLKLVTNLISACTVQALAESLATATRHGIDPALLAEAVARNASGSPLAAMKLPAMARGDFEPHFSLANMLKDSRYALELAAGAGIETPAIRAVSHRMAELCEAGLGGHDYSVLATPYFPR